jgi:LacI family transcriptional regulator
MLRMRNDSAHASGKIGAATEENIVMRIRIEDVAEAAGVSMKTVSRVLNQEPNVREETRRKVETAVEKLQYKPNPSARSLAGQRSYVVAMIYDNPSSNYLMEVQGGMLDACRANHYNLILGPVAYDKPDCISQITDLIQHSRSDGVVLTPPLTDDVKLLGHLDEMGVPFASISPRTHRGRIGVTLDEHGAVFEMVSHLISLGHRRIGHIKGHPDHGASEWRHSGYREALKHAGIAYDTKLVVKGEFSYDSGVRGANRLLDLDDPPTAIFAANDDTAAGVIRAAGKRGLVVPEDLSICGFDDTPIARQIFPQLTTVRQPTREMGRVATLELLKAIRDADAGEMMRMGYTLQLRESTSRRRKTR